MGRPGLSFPAVWGADGGCRPARFAAAPSAAGSVPRCGHLRAASTGNPMPRRAGRAPVIQARYALASRMARRTGPRRRNCGSHLRKQGRSAGKRVARIGAARPCARRRNGRSHGRYWHRKQGQFAATRRRPGHGAGFARHDTDEAADPSRYGHPCALWRLQADTRMPNRTLAAQDTRKRVPNHTTGRRAPAAAMPQVPASAAAALPPCGDRRRGAGAAQRKMPERTGFASMRSAGLSGTLRRLRPAPPTAWSRLDAVDSMLSERARPAMPWSMRPASGPCRAYGKAPSSRRQPRRIQPRLTPTRSSPAVCR